MNYKSYTMSLQYLQVKVDYVLNEYFNEPRDVTVENVGKMLCGVNWELAKKPFSKEFIENVAYNTTNSFYLVLWLQLNSL